MRLAIVANEKLKEELLATGKAEDLIIDWVSSASDLTSFTEADAVIDLLFKEDRSNTDILKKFLPRPVIINSVVKTIEDIGLSFIRINGWPTFLKREIVEASCKEEKDKMIAGEIFSGLNKKPEWVPDVAGFISARVIAMIINEAYFALSEKVSTKEEIDLAMKLGTNYPFGPFEWAEKIGVKNISDLLTELSKKEKRYEPSALLIRETAQL